MKPYLITSEFYYDGKLRRTRTTTQLCESPNEDIEDFGSDFESLWDFRCKTGYYFTSLDMYENKKGKRSLCFDGELKNITPKNCKPWKFVVSSKETSISMERLMQFDTESVIQYLKERGMTACPILK